MIVLDAIAGKPTDRVPVAPLITAGYASKVYGITVPEYVLDNKKYAEAQIFCKKYHSYDWVWAHQPFQGASTWEKDNAVRQGDRVILTLEVGTKIMLPIRGAPQTLEPAIKSKEDLDQLEIPDQYSKERLAPLRYMLEREDFVCGAVRGPFTLASTFLYDLESFLFEMKRDKKFILRLLDFSLDYCREIAQAQIEAGVNAIFMADSSASSSVISPTDYREFVFPYERTLIKEIAKHIPVILHICGDISHILDDMIRTGASCLSFDELTEITAVHKKIPAWGNVPSSLLSNGTPKDVREASEEIIKLRSRVVLSSGCVVPGNAREENIKEMVRVSYSSSSSSPPIK
jgi:uroporphyrinogen decarboxylase